MELNVLAIGDVVATSGLDCLHHHLHRLKKEHKIHFCIVNGENTANGLGISRKTPHAARHTAAGRTGLPQKILGRFDSSTAANLHTRTDTQARIDAVENNTPFPKIKTHHDRSTKAPAPLPS